jgi:hypothetical protein
MTIHGKHCHLDVTVRYAAEDHKEDPERRYRRFPVIFPLAGKETDGLPTVPYIVVLYVRYLFGTLHNVGKCIWHFGVPSANKLLHSRFSSRYLIGGYSLRAH